ncbi:MFS family permease [Catenulispora sp. GAS73]|uniref:MFS transporter n=1 Tax=Catenulispora sp. GAS73 TaxID=3156269 RepID=UPI003515805C
MSSQVVENQAEAPRSEKRAEHAEPTDRAERAAHTEPTGRAARSEPAASAEHANRADRAAHTAPADQAGRTDPAATATRSEPTAAAEHAGHAGHANRAAHTEPASRAAHSKPTASAEHADRAGHTAPADQAGRTDPAATAEHAGHANRAAHTEPASRAAHSKPAATAGHANRPDRAARTEPADQAGHVWTRVSLFLGGQGISLVCDQVFFIAVVWAAAQYGGNAAVTWVTLGESIPRALTMIFGGVICDAFGPRAVLLRTTSVRIAVLGAAAAAAASVHSVWLLVAVAALEGAMLGLGSPSFGTILPRMVSAEQLGRANSVRAMAMRFAPIMGPPIGAWLVAGGHLPAALAVVCGGVVVSQVCVRWVTRGVEVPAAHRKALWRRMGGGFVLLRHDARLRWLFLSALCVDLGFAWPFNPALPVVILHRGWGVSAVGILIACFGAGALSSAALGAVLDGRIPMSVRYVGSGVALAAGLLGMILVPSLTAMAAAAFVVGVASGQNAPASATLYQRAAPPDQLGVAMSMLSLSGIGAAPLAYSVFGALASATTPTVAWIASAVLAFGGPIAGIRALRTPATVRAS